MGKIIITIAFLVFFCLSLYVYFSRNEKSLVANLRSNSVKEPLVVLSDFTVFRYSEKTLLNSASARLGYLVDPTMLELYGNIKGINYKNKEMETIKAETGMAFFNSTHLKELFSEVELLKAQVKDYVQVEKGGYKISTDYAELDAKRDVIFTDRPMRMEGHNCWLIGKNGFKYNMNTEEVELDGEIRGEFVPNDKQQY